MTALLDERELSAAEREAIGDEPRPGVWIEDADTKRRYGGADKAGDGRAFTQDETDRVIARELYDRHPHAWMRQVIEPWRGPVVHVTYDGDRTRPAEQQRGGIASDPLVRLLAYRAWGDRDRKWFERELDRKRMAVEKVNEMIALGMLVVPRGD